LAENKNNTSAAAAPTQYVLGAITGKEPKLTIQFKETKNQIQTAVCLAIAMGDFVFSLQKPEIPQDAYIPAIANP
jgi:hypothetical protein